MNWQRKGRRVQKKYKRKAKGGKTVTKKGGKGSSKFFKGPLSVFILLLHSYTATEIEIQEIENLLFHSTKLKNH